MLSEGKIFVFCNLVNIIDAWLQVMMFTHVKFDCFKTILKKKDFFNENVKLYIYVNFLNMS